LGSKTLIVVESADDFTQHTRCRPRPIPVLKKVQ
jgi:hypothetical protein